MFWSLLILLQKKKYRSPFFTCSFARFVWNVVICSIGLSWAPNCFQELLDKWLLQFSRRDMKIAIVGVAAILWTLWKTRNDACFRCKWPYDPSSVFFVVCSTIDSWAGLQKAGSQEMLRQWSHRLWQVVAEVIHRSRGWASTTYRLEIWGVLVADLLQVF